MFFISNRIALADGICGWDIEGDREGEWGLREGSGELRDNFLNFELNLI